jgi:hypothetical protein
MSETIVPAKRWDQLWFHKADGRGWDIVSVVAWAVPGSGPSVPITAFGRFDTSKPYVVGNGNGFIAFPSGHMFSDTSSVDYYLRTGDAI